MFNKVMAFLDSNNILYKHQYGFRRSHSFTHSQIHFLSHIANVNNKGNPELNIIVHLRKAFDTINHEILLQKLKRYSITGIANEWI